MAWPNFSNMLGDVASKLLGDQAAKDLSEFVNVVSTDTSVAVTNTTVAVTTAVTKALADGEAALSEGGESGTWEERDDQADLALRPPESGSYRLRLTPEELLDSAGQPLQTPIVVSDIDGNIKFANRACCELLGRSVEEIKDANFFAVFSQPDRRGQSIEDYLKRFDQNTNQSTSMTVSIQNAAGGKVLRANCVSMQWDHQRLLVTQLS
jgi:PAS domain S-box-containing protein